MHRVFIAVFACWVGFQGCAFGAISVAFDPETTSLAAGDETTIKVMVTGDGETIDSFDFLFRITPNVGTSRLEFLQYGLPDPIFSDPDYLFYLNSSKELDGANLGEVETEFAANDLYNGFDIVFPLDAVRSIGSDPLLMATLRIKHVPVGDPPLAIPDSFTVTLVESGSAFWIVGESEPTRPTASTVITISAAPAAVVPEPFSLTIWTAAGLMGLVCPWRRRRARAS